MVTPFDNGLDVEILKVGHLDSKYSSFDAFLSEASPSGAVIDIGEAPNYLARGS